MMKAIVRCIDCSDAVVSEVEEATYKGLCTALASAVLLCHVTPPHTSHRMKYELHGAEEANGTGRPLAIRCLQAACAKKDIIMAFDDVAPELVPALAIVFHASHEGHPLELAYDGRVWSSPGQR